MRLYGEQSINYFALRFFYLSRHFSWLKRPLHLGQIILTLNFSRRGAFALAAKPTVNAGGEAAKGLVMNRVKM